MVATSRFTSAAFDMPLVPNLIELTYGANTIRPAVAGHSVEAIRISFADVLSVGPDAIPYVGLIRVPNHYIARPGDQIDWVLEWGIKGAARWFSLKQASEYLGIGVKSLVARCKAKEITYSRVGQRGRMGKGEYRFQQEWLDAFIQSVTVPSKQKEEERRRPQRRVVLSKIYIDPSKCGNPFE